MPPEERSGSCRIGPFGCSICTGAENIEKIFRPLPVYSSDSAWAISSGCSVGSRFAIDPGDLHRLGRMVRGDHSLPRDRRRRGPDNWAVVCGASRLPVLSRLRVLARRRRWKIRRLRRRNRRTPAQHHDAQCRGDHHFLLVFRANLQRHQRVPPSLTFSALAASGASLAGG